jgi:hypothetical protein
MTAFQVVSILFATLFSFGVVLFELSLHDMVSGSVSRINERVSNILYAFLGSIGT